MTIEREIEFFQFPLGVARSSVTLIAQGLHTFSIFLILLMGCSGTLPESIGKFAPCPDKPNCVSSKSSLSLSKIDPLTYKGSPQEAKRKLLGIIKSMPHTRVAANRDNFIHVESTSRIFGFVDDVEFFFEESGTIHFRSASRVGHSDMGVNRERMEEIRRLFTAG